MEKRRNIQNMQLQAAEIAAQIEVFERPIARARLCLVALAALSIFGIAHG